MKIGDLYFLDKVFAYDNDRLWLINIHFPTNVLLLNGLSVDMCATREKGWEKNFNTGYYPQVLPHKTNLIFIKKYYGELKLLMG